MACAIDGGSMALAASERFGWYNRNTAYNLYTIEGKKTMRSKSPRTCVQTRLTSWSFRPAMA
jgi:hypothetical protein